MGITDNYIQNQFQQLLPPEIRVDVSSVAIRRLAAVEQVAVTTSKLLFSGEVVLNQCFTVQDQKEETRGEVLFVAGSMAGKSQQPLMLAIRRSAEQMGIPLREVDTDPLSGGMVGTLDRTAYVLGSGEALASEDVEVGRAAQAVVQQLEGDGLTPLFLARLRPNRLLAIFAILRKTDTLAVHAVRRLVEDGCLVVLCTNQPAPQYQLATRQLPSLLVHAVEDEKDRAAKYRQLYEEKPATLLVTDKVIAAGNDQLVLQVGGKEGLAVAHLSQLPVLLEAAAASMQSARKRFFWVR